METNNSNIEVIIEGEEDLESEDENMDAMRIKSLGLPEMKMDLRGWRKIVRHNFPDLVFPAEMGLAIMAQILIKDVSNPFALVLVDMPSSGKTITVNFFAGIEGLTYASDKFTPASFVSNASNVKKKDLPKLDLLPRIRYKMFILRDLATLFSKRDDDLAESLGIMTRILDGEGLTTDTGVHGQREYTGDFLFMLLAASTPISPKVWKVMGNLGSRLFFLNMHTQEKSEDELAEQIVNESHKVKELNCRLATQNLLLTLWAENPDGISWEKEQDPLELRKMISKCAKLLAKLRGVINVWKDRSADGEEYEHNSPVIEKPDRLNQWFYNLARGHAVVAGRRNIAIQDIKFVIALTLDSCPPERSKLFRELLQNHGNLTTDQVMEKMNWSRPTALKHMKALSILGITKAFEPPHDGMGRRTPDEITLIQEFRWFLSEEFEEIRKLNTGDTLFD